jgi:DNA-binding response OmpR family regulator
MPDVRQASKRFAHCRLARQMHGAFTKERSARRITVEDIGNVQGSSDAAGRRTARTPKFLIAEDDPEMRALIVYALGRDGAEIVETDRGVHLLRWVERAACAPDRDLFDAIISDVQMPDCTALDVLSKVPSVPRNTPVVLVTAFGDEETRRAAYALGAEMVLDKPVHPDDLRALARSLARRRTDRPTR